MLVRSALGRVLVILGLIAITARARLHRASRCPRARARQHAFLADHDRADARWRSSPRSSTRSPGRTRRSGWRARGRRRSATWSFFGALAVGRLDTTVRARARRVTPLHAGDRRSRSARWSCAGLFRLAGRARLRAVGRRRPARTTRRASSSRRRRAPEGWLRPGWRARPPGRRGSRSAWSRSRSWSTSSRYMPWAAHREPPALAGLPGRPHRPDARSSSPARCTTTTTT